MFELNNITKNYLTQKEKVYYWRIVYKILKSSEGQFYFKVSGSFSVAEHLSHYPKFEDSNPTMIVEKSKWKWLPLTYSSARHPALTIRCALTMCGPNRHASTSLVRYQYNKGFFFVADAQDKQKVFLVILLKSEFNVWGQG